MSHFLVMVVGNGVDEMMEPFSEENDDNDLLKDDGELDYYRQKAKEDEKPLLEIVEAEGYVNADELSIDEQPLLTRWYCLDEKGNVKALYRRANLHATWDWYSVGGRWTEIFNYVDGERHRPCLKKKHYDFSAGPPYCYAILDREKGWQAQGRMGWFGLSDDKFTNEEWQKYIAEYFEKIDDEETITFLDCHI